MKAGVIGTSYGRVHIIGLQAAGLDVVAVCQRNQDEARAVANQYGIPRIYADWEVLVASPDLDLVTIAAPPHLHLPMTKKALRLGKHVICEKPLARTVEEARLMVRLAREARGRAMIGFNWRFTAGMQKMKTLVDQGFLGRLLHATGAWYGQRYADAAAPLSWRNERELAGVGALGDAGVHVIDALRWLGGEFRQVSGMTGIAYPGRELVPGKPLSIDDHCGFLGILDSDAHVTVTLSRVARGTNFHRYELFGTDGALSYEFHRDETGWATGSLSWVHGHGAWEPVPLSLPSSEPPPSDFSERIGRATFAPLARVLLDAVAHGREVSPSFSDGLRAQAVAEAVLQSAEEEAWVTVPG